MIHGHGDDLYSSHRDIRANFSTNVWYGADMEPLCIFLQDKIPDICHYPEPDAISFKRIAADYHGVSEDNIWVGNGATELFYLIAHAFAGGHTLLPVPSFTEYEDACRLYGHKMTFLSDMDIDHLPVNADLMFICNPNNPDGRIWSENQIRTLLDKYPKMLLVIDESFIWFAPEAHSAIPLLDKYQNLVIIRSMTKCYAIPGLRLGYLLGDESIIKKVSRFGFPWSVNVLAIEAGKYLLECGNDILPDADLLLQRQHGFSARLAEIPGFEPQESHTSFFLVKCKMDSKELKRRLIDDYGILIRDASNFRGLDCHYFRINTLTEEKNGWLLDALNDLSC